MAAGQSASLAYSREDELQADQLAFDYLDRAGYSSMGLLTSLCKKCAVNSGLERIRFQSIS